MRRGGVVAAVAAAILVSYIALAGRLLVQTGASNQADVVVVLSGDPLGDRLQRAADLAESGEMEKVLVFLPFDGLYDTRDDASAYLRMHGIPEARVRLVKARDSTAEEVGIVAELVRRCRWTKVVAVTSPYHTRRAGWLFRRAIGREADVTMVSTNESFEAGRW